MMSPAWLMIIASAIPIMMVSADVKKPIIGILTRQIPSTMQQTLINNGYSEYNSYIPSSYVKFFESGGSRIIPILLNKDKEYYKEILSIVNGLVFPGGKGFRDTPYGDAGEIIYDLLMEEDMKIPLMGICLGFQMIMHLHSGKKDPLVPCKDDKRADPLKFKDGWIDSDLFGKASDDVIDTLKNEDSTSNFHNYCVTESTFNNLDLDNDFEILSTSFDDNGLEYISAVEHRNLPIYGLQFHPEKNSYEWVYGSIPHSKESIVASQHFANHFVEKARQSPAAKVVDVTDILIYNYESVHIRKYYKSAVMEGYYFEPLVAAAG